MAELIAWTCLLIAAPLIVMSHELGHYWMARRLGVRVQAVAFGFGPSVVRCQWHGVQWRINILPLGGYVQLDRTKESGLSGLRALAEAAILLSGIVLNLALGALIIFMAISLPSDETHGSLVVSEVLDGTPAHEAGMVTGDRILAVDGDAVTSIRSLWAANRGVGPDGGVYEIHRGSENIEMLMIPDDGRVGVTLGIDGPVQHPYLPSFNTVFRRGLEMTWWVAAAPVAAMLDGSWSARTEWNETETGFPFVLLVVGGLSIHMGLINLLPIPGLDGGQLLFLVIGKVCRRPVSWRMRQVAEMLGISLVLGFVSILLIMDMFSNGGM